MGILDRIQGGFAPAPKSEIKAQVSPAVFDAPYGYNFGGYGYGQNNGFANSINRMQAAAVPAVAACRNLIVSPIAAIPLELYSLKTGEELNPPTWLRQPDKRSSRALTIAWTVDSLYYWGQAFWQVKSVDENGRPNSFEWIQNDRVSSKLTQYSAEVEYYMVNNVRVPMSGVGSLITFQHLDQGILYRGARTIQSAIDIERAAWIASQTPQPSGYIKNTGAEMPDDRVQGLLNAWRNARQARATAYLSPSLEYVPTQFSPKDMMYNDAAQFLASQIARMSNVPAWMINAEQQKSMTYQNILDSRKEFLAYTLSPYINTIESRLSMDDLTPRGQIVKFSVDETFLRGNAVDRLTVIEKMLELGLIDLNKAKEMEQLAPEGSGEVDEPNV